MRLSSIAVIFLAVAMLFCARISKGDEWLPVTPEELKMTSEPKAPGSPAIYLYRQVDRNDSNRAGTEYNYVRVKILRRTAGVKRTWRLPFGKARRT